jgi:hypothetical protein
MAFKDHNLYKLSTREDKYLFHKTIGTFCILHFIYRYFHLFFYNTMGFQYNSKFTLFSLLMHGLLSLSSLIFNIPKFRHQNKPMIYKEFRLHSIVFALRSVLCSLVFYYKQSIYLNILIINLTMIAADIISYYFKAESKTMRGMPFGKELTQEQEKRITRMQSSQQISATVYMMFNIDSTFSPIFAIQIAAFLMTLVRKNIIDELDWHRIYIISLMITIFIFIPFEKQIQAFFVLFTIYTFRYLRFYLNQNKYLVWNIILFFYVNIIDYIPDVFINSIYYNIYISIVMVLYLRGQVKESSPIWWSNMNKYLFF